MFNTHMFIQRINEAPDPMRMKPTKPPVSILKYEQENNKDFRIKKSSRKIISKSDLIESVKQADVTFIADFHTFDQAQRTALRIFRETVKPHENWRIGLEMIPTQFQNILNAFQKGEVSLEAFHEAIQYEKEWGFPWSHYEPIFCWARENEVPLIALNKPKPLLYYHPEKDLHDRDQWAAGVITDLFYNERKEDTQPRMLVLYGELHVGTQHLPKQLTRISRSFLKKPLNWITIHQNYNELYWQLAEQDLLMKTEAIQLKPKTYCVFSSTPWAKLQSLVSWAEGGQDQRGLDQDHLSIVQTYGSTLSHFLKVKSPPYEDLSVYTISEAEKFESLHLGKPFSTSEVNLIRFHIQFNKPLYVPQTKTAFLGSPSHNRAAELAAIHILHSYRKVTHLFYNSAEDYFRMVLEAAFGFFGSLILNPKRKCDLPQDHFNRIKSLGEGQKEVFPNEILSRRITLKTLSLVSNQHPEFTLEMNQIASSRKLSPALLMGARFTGQILGKILHDATLAEQVTISFVKEAFLAPSPPSNLGVYFELIRAVSSTPIELSKLEHL